MGVDRYDIYNNLPRGSRILLSLKFKCNKSHITQVLQGKRRDNMGIIKAAELMSATHIWKTRFCKLEKSQL